MNLLPHAAKALRTPQTGPHACKGCQARCSIGPAALCWEDLRAPRLTCNLRPDPRARPRNYGRPLCHQLLQAAPQPRGGGAALGRQQVGEGNAHVAARATR